MLFVDYSSAFNIIIPEEGNCPVWPSLPHLLLNTRLPDLSAAGSKGWTALYSDIQYWRSTGLCTKSSPVFSVHIQLPSNPPLQLHHQVCCWHYSDRSDHVRRQVGLQGDDTGAGRVMLQKQPGAKHLHDKQDGFLTSGNRGGTTLLQPAIYIWDLLTICFIGFVNIALVWCVCEHRSVATCRFSACTVVWWQ